MIFSVFQKKSALGVFLVHPPMSPVLLSASVPYAGFFFIFFWRKSFLAMAAGRDKKKLKSFLAAVLLSASVERCFVFRRRDFLSCSNPTEIICGFYSSDDSLSFQH